MPKDTSNGNGHHQDESLKARFERWHGSKAELVEKTVKGKIELVRAKPRFTPDFNTALQAVIDDETLPAEVRCLAWVKRYAWGNSSDWAINENGEPLGNRDCADELGLSESVVSRAFKELRSRNLVALTGGRLCPVFNPAKKQRKFAEVHNDFEPLKIEQEPLYQQFKKIWAAEHPQEAVREAEAEKILHEIRQRKLNDFKKWKREQAGNGLKEEPESCEGTQLTVAEGHNGKLQRAATNGAPILISSTVSTLDTVSQSVSPPAALATDRLTKISAAIPISLVDRLNEVPSPALLAQIETKLNGAPLEKLTERINQRNKAITSLGLIERLAEDVGKAHREAEANRKAAARSPDQESRQREEERAREEYDDWIQHETLKGMEDLTEEEIAKLQAAATKRLKAEERYERLSKQQRSAEIDLYMRAEITKGLPTFAEWKRRRE